jgi:heterodisulfide reductase subunit C
MTVKIKSRTTGNGPNLKQIIEERSGADLSLCYQCLKCSGGCPVARIVQCPPSEIIRRLHLGAGNELLESDLIWECLSCGTCYARCPMGIDIASVMDILRTMTLEKKAVAPKGNMPLFNRMFLWTVRAFGRTYDLSMILGYKFGTGKFFNDADKFPAMLRKGKIAVLPPAPADTRIVRQIFNRTRQSKGNIK